MGTQMLEDKKSKTYIFILFQTTTPNCAQNLLLALHFESFLEGSVDHMGCEELMSGLCKANTFHIVLFLQSKIYNII